jgi:hypothetical protein
MLLCSQRWRDLGGRHTAKRAPRRRAPQHLLRVAVHIDVVGHVGEQAGDLTHSAHAVSPRPAHARVRNTRLLRSGCGTNATEPSYGGTNRTHLFRLDFVLPQVGVEHKVHVHDRQEHEQDEHGEVEHLKQRRAAVCFVEVDDCRLLDAVVEVLS